jgi:hypothetical protein
MYRYRWCKRQVEEKAGDLISSSLVYCRRFRSMSAFSMEIAICALSTFRNSSLSFVKTGKG